MRLISLLLILLFLNSLSAERPNIVLIMADDLGFADLGCYGSEIETPTLDTLAGQGLRFNQFYNTAKCHSSRICLLSGLYMFQAGNTSLNKAVTIAEVLQPSGYSTFMAGKWHLQNSPYNRGFEQYFGHLSGACNFFTGDNTFRLNDKPFKVPDRDFYTTDANTDYALRFLEERNKEKPFFLYMAYNAPHYPLHVKESDFRKYEKRYAEGWDSIRSKRYAKQQKLGILPQGIKLTPRPEEVKSWENLSAEDKKWESERMAAYAGMIDCLDSNIGRIVSYLKKNNLFDNTVIIFCSDNGACPFERTRGKEKRPWDPKSYWTYDKGWAHVGNTPFRLYKQNQHEGGISSPMIVSWPKGLKTDKGSITSQPGHLIDFMATCIDLAGADYPKEYDGRKISPLQGKSLVPIFEGKTRKPHEWLYFQFSGNRAVRKGNMKLVRHKSGPWELFNLAEDRSEMNNLIKSKPEQAEELKKLWYHISENIEGTPAKMRTRVSEKSAKKKK